MHSILISPTVFQKNYAKNEEKKCLDKLHRGQIVNQRALFQTLQVPCPKGLNVEYPGKNNEKNSFFCCCLFLEGVPGER